MSDIVQKLWGFCHALWHDGVAPTGSRLYRRLEPAKSHANSTFCRLPIGDTAGCQPALLDMASEESNPGLDRVRHALRVTGVPTDAPNPLRSGIHTRGYLPHVKREGVSYFVTFRLGDSLPQEILLDFKRQQA